MENDFVGREDFVEMYSNAWNECNLLGIFGIKTVGKSRVAREIIKRQLQLDPAMKHDVIDMQGKGQLKVLVMQLLSLLGLHAHIETQVSLEESMETIVDTVLLFSVNRHYVIYIDNCDRIIDKDEHTFTYFCKALLQRTKNTKILITSGISPSLETFPGLRVFFRELSPLSHEASYKLLKSVVHELVEEEGKVIAELCCGLPLVVMMVGTELSSPDSLYTQEDMVVLLTQCRMQSLGSEFYPASERVGIIFGKLIDKLSYLFQQRLASLQYIPVSFHRQQALAMIDDDDGNEADENSSEAATIKYLRMHHLLSIDDVTGRYNIHGILRECIQMYTVIKDIKKVRERFCRTFADVFKEISSKYGTEAYVEALERLGHEFPNLQKLLDDVQYSSSDTYHVFVELVMTSSELMHDYMGVESLRFYKKCLEITPNFGQPQDEAILKIGQGKCLVTSKAQIKEAEKCYRQSILLIKDDPISPIHVVQYTALGRNLQQQSRREEALRNLSLALDIAGRLGMVDEDVILETLMGLGSIYSSAETYEQAEFYLEKALERGLNRFGTDHNLTVAQCYNFLGLHYQTKRTYPVAFEFFKTALNIRRNMRAAVRPLVLSLNNVAMQYSVHGNNEEAVRLLNEAKITLDRSPSAHQMSYIATYENLARLHHRMRNYDSALVYFDQVLSIRNVETPGNINVVEMLELLGGTYYLKMRYIDCINTLEKAISYKAAVIEHAPGYQLVLYCYLNLMDALAHEGRIERLKEVTSEARSEVKRLVQFHLPINNPKRAKLYQDRFHKTYESIRYLLGE